MPGPVARKEDAAVLEELRQYLQEIDVGILSEFDEGDFRGFWVKFGDFPLILENQKGKIYYIVAFQITLPDGPERDALNAYYEKKDPHFIFELTKAFTSPLTGFSRIIEGGKVVGFTLSRYIYPYYHDFSVKDLDRAFQAVVSQGAEGIAFLKTIRPSQSESPRV
ncbi:MAG: hypothetical protein MUC66_01210 [Methanolinea sp.]|jgi:hypothetical protein|nr:hypothetical protein [Methanolinea sp.]